MFLKCYNILIEVHCIVILYMHTVYIVESQHVYTLLESPVLSFSILLSSPTTFPLPIFSFYKFTFPFFNGFLAHIWQCSRSGEPRRCWTSSLGSPPAWKALLYYLSWPFSNSFPGNWHKLIIFVKSYFWFTQFI